MRPVNIIIVEDIFHIAKGLKEDLQHLGYEVVAVFKHLREFQSKHHDYTYDLAIIDLQLGEDYHNRDGWEVVNRLTKSGITPIIIHTAHSADEVWRRIDRASSISYLAKTTNRLRLGEEIGNLLVRVHGANILNSLKINAGNNSIQNFNSGGSTFFFIKNSETKQKERFEIANIRYIQAGGSKGIVIHHIRGEKEFSQSLEGFLKQCQHPDLMRVHNSYVVNRQVIESFDTDHIRLVHGGRSIAIPISKSYRSAIEEWAWVIKSK